MLWLIVGIIFYVGMSVFIAGKHFAYWQREWGKYIETEEDKWGDWWFSWFTGLIWLPIFPFILFRKHPISRKRIINCGWTLNYKNPRKGKLND